MNCIAALRRSLRRCIIDVPLRLIVDDSLAIMSDFWRAMDFIDEHVSDNDILRDNLQCWRTLLGQWKSTFAHDVTYMTYLDRMYRCHPDTAVHVLSPNEHKHRLTGYI